MSTFQMPNVWRTTVRPAHVQLSAITKGLPDLYKFIQHLSCIEDMEQSHQQDCNVAYLLTALDEDHEAYVEDDGEEPFSTYQTDAAELETRLQAIANTLDPDEELNIWMFE